MCELKALEVAHVAELVKEPGNAHLAGWIKSGHAKQLADGPDAVAGIIDGEVMFCGGVLTYWTGRGFIWGVFSERSKRHGIATFRAIERWMDARPHRRLEVDVPLDVSYSKTAHRRVRLLGFKMECERAKHFRSSGKDSALYSRIRGGS